MEKIMHPAVQQIMNFYKELEKDDDYTWARWVQTRKKFTMDSANKFFIGIMLDQGQDAERAWLVAEHFVDCHFDDEKSLWEQILETHHAELQRISTKGYRRKSYALRYQTYKFHKWLKDAARTIIEEYQGDVRNIWNGVQPKNVDEIYNRFKEFQGIGDGLAKMAQFILVRNYGVAGGYLSRSSMKIKTDVLLRRVVYRTGISKEESAKAVIKAVENLGLESQADFDGAAWTIGNRFCFKTKPNCGKCPIEKSCEKAAICRT